MPWHIVERRLGKAGGPKQRHARQRLWDRTYGPDAWVVGYLVEGDFMPRDDALEAVYYRSYERYFDAHPEALEALIETASQLHNPHAEATGGVDLQVPAIMDYLRRNNLRLRGRERLDIGSWGGHGSHPLSVQLSPLTIPCAVAPRMTLERFWQRQKCLAVWRDDDA